MTDTEKLYETLGELLYVVAKADGTIQDKERSSLENLLKGHKSASEIKWSFDYEETKQNSVEDTYAKVIAVCHRIGPSPIYNEFIEAMDILAKAYNGIENEESKIINSFSSDLIARFKKDLDI